MDVSICQFSYLKKNLPVDFKCSTVPQFLSSTSKKPIPTKDHVMAKEPASETVAPQVATATSPLPQATPIASDGVGKEVKSEGKNNKPSKEKKAGGSGKH